MNVNRIDPNLQMQAEQLLKSNVKADHSQEELEVLWEYKKQTEDFDLGDLTDADIIAHLDMLDNEKNSLKTAWRMLENDLKEGDIPKADVSATPDTPAAPSEPQAPVETPTTPVVPDDTVSDDVNNGPFVVPDADDTLVTSPNPPVVENTPVEDTTANDTPAVDTPVAAPEAATPKENTPNANEKVFLSLYPKGSQTIEINGKTYTVENQSKTSNTFSYYMNGDTLCVEGHFLKVSSNDDNADNVKVVGNSNTVDMKAGDDLLEVEGDMNMIYAGEGNDFIKVRGDMNSVDLGVDADTVWIAGNNNMAHGGDNVQLNKIDGDNFFAMGAKNSLFGQEGTDAAYYNTTDAVEGMFTAGVGQELRIEETITDGSDFEDWVHGDDDNDGPPYNTLPDALDGHEVRAYDDNTYTDKYEKEPVYYTEYRDIAYRELDVMTTQNKETGEGTVIDYNEDGAEASKITLNPDGSIVVNAGDMSATIPADEATFYDSEGNVVANTGSLESTLEKLATGKLFVGDKNGVTPQMITAAMEKAQKANELYENNQDPSQEATLKANAEAANAELQKLLNG